MPSLISLMVSVDVKHNVCLLTRAQEYKAPCDHVHTQQLYKVWIQHKFLFPTVCCQHALQILRQQNVNVCYHNTKPITSIKYMFKWWNVVCAWSLTLSRSELASWLHPVGSLWVEAGHYPSRMAEISMPQTSDELSAPVKIPTQGINKYLNSHTFNSKWMKNSNEWGYPHSVTCSYARH